MQRPGKTKRAAMSDSMADMRLRNFFRDCQELFDEHGDEDAAIFFENLVDHLNAGKPMPTDKREISRMMGL
jgi:hypothetical protein